MKQDKQNTKNTKSSQVSIKWKLFFYIALFSTVLLFLLWLFQVVFLDQFYRHIKTEQIENTAHDIVKNIGNADLENYINNKVDNTDYCIRIIDMDSQLSYTNESNRGVCGVMITSPSEILSMYEDALQNDGETLKITSVGLYEDFNDYREYSALWNKDESAIVKDPSFVKTGDAFQTMTFGEIAHVGGHDFFVLVNSRITLVNEISTTLRTQLVIIAGIMMVLAVVMALLIANRISKPIIKINHDAKKLAKGDFSVQFEGKGYLEIEELNETLNYASEELSKVETLRNELLANMSHDLRTPLTMISGYGEVMRDIPGENTPENVQVIIDEAKRLNVLVNDILDLSKLQAGIQELKKETFSLTAKTREITSRFAAMLKQDGYTITFEATEEVQVKADMIKMEQVIYNLLVNAVHYSVEDKTIKVIQVIENNQVTIQVHDKGEGIAEKDLPYVWDRYYKIDKVHKRNTVGSGLGLSIVRSILELHHATYGVRSKVKEGSTFYFTLPIQK